MTVFVTPDVVLGVYLAGVPVTGMTQALWHSWRGTGTFHAERAAWRSFAWPLTAWVALLCLVSVALSLYPALLARLSVSPAQRRETAAAMAAANRAVAIQVAEQEADASRVAARKASDVYAREDPAPPVILAPSRDTTLSYAITIVPGPAEVAGYVRPCGAGVTIEGFGIPAAEANERAAQVMEAVDATGNSKGAWVNCSCGRVHVGLTKAGLTYDHTVPETEIICPNARTRFHDRPVFCGNCRGVMTYSQDWAGCHGCGHVPHNEHCPCRYCRHKRAARRAPAPQAETFRTGGLL